MKFENFTSEVINIRPNDFYGLPMHDIAISWQK